MQKIIFLFLVSLLSIFSYQFHFGLGGMHDNKKIINKIIQQRDNTFQLELRNNSLANKVNNLKASRDILEAKIRTEMNLVKPDETLVLLEGNTFAIKRK